MVVVVVVAAYIAPWASEALGSNFLGGVAAGAAGSVAGQTVMIASGQQQGINWNTVALTALTYGVGNSVSASTMGDSLRNATSDLSAFGRGALNGAINSATTQAIGSLFHIDHFSWRNVAVSAVSAGAAAVAGREMGKAQYGSAWDSMSSSERAMNVSQAADRTFASGLAAGVTSAAMRGNLSSQSLTQIGMDVMSATIGNAIADDIAARKTPTQTYQLDFRNAGPGVGDEFAAYNSANYPSLASSDAYSAYTGAYGLNGRYADSSAHEGDYLTLHGSERTAVVDEFYSAAMYLQSIGAPAVDFSQLSRDEAIQYVRDYSQLGTHHDAYDAPMMTVTASAEDIRAAYAEVPQSYGDLGSFRGMSGAEAFFEFTGLGQMLTGAGHRVRDMAVGATMMRPQMLPVMAAHYQQAYNAGHLGDTLLHDVGGLVTSTLSPLKALNEMHAMGGMERLGAGVVDASMMLGPMSAERLAAERMTALGGVPNNGPRLTQYGTTLDQEIAAIRGMSSPRPASSLRQAYQQARGQVDFAHIEADIDFTRPASKQVMGGHFSTSPNTQIVPGTESVGTNGSIFAKVELKAADGNWYSKTNNSGFSSLTPDAWSLARAKGEMSQAWLNRAAVPSKSYYVGTSSGVSFRFFPPAKTAPLWRGYPEYTP
jgi:hypothetical protein